MPNSKEKLETSKTENSWKVEILTKNREMCNFLKILGIVVIEVFAPILFQCNAEQETERLLGHSQAPFFSR